MQQKVTVVLVLLACVATTTRTVVFVDALASVAGTTSTRPPASKRLCGKNEWEETRTVELTCNTRRMMFRRALLAAAAVVGAAVGATTPTAAQAAEKSSAGSNSKDCLEDCLKNCKLLAPKDTEYCDYNCQEYWYVLLRRCMLPRC